MVCEEKNLYKVLHSVPEGFIVCLDNLRAHDKNSYMCLKHKTVTFKSKYDIIKSGCDKCSSFNRSSAHATDISDVKVRMYVEDKEGYTFDWDTYTKITGKMGMTCPEGHNCNIAPSKFLYGRRCSSCSKYGFDKEIPAWFYLVRWDKEGLDFLKYGITNRDYHERLETQRMKSGLQYEIILTELFDKGSKALSVEQFCREHVGKKYIDKFLFPDGYTETVAYDNSYITQIKQRVKYGI